MCDSLEYAECRSAAKNCAMCGGKFGLIRYYSWRTALCSKKCLDLFRARRERDRRWLLQQHTVSQPPFSEGALIATTARVVARE